MVDLKNVFTRLIAEKERSASALPTGRVQATVRRARMFGNSSLSVERRVSIKFLGRASSLVARHNVRQRKSSFLKLDG